MSDAPHLLVVGAENSRDPGPARLRQETKRGARWLLHPIGEEISEKGEELLGAQRTGGRTEARSWRATAADRVPCGGVYDRGPPPPSAFTWTPTPHVQARSGEAGCPARRGPWCRGRGEAAGDSVFTAELFRTAAVDRAVPGSPVPFEILPLPGFEALARLGGK